MRNIKQSSCIMYHNYKKQGKPNIRLLMVSAITHSAPALGKILKVQRVIVVADLSQFMES